MKIVPLVQSALDTAAAQHLSQQSRQQLHRERSKQFVEIVASYLRSHFKNSPNVAVLSKHFDQNRPRFGLNELLYDILVCEVGVTRSATGVHELTYVAKGLWAIESEFARDSREAMFDFNKLILSSSENALFIGPKVTDEAGYLQPLAAAAECCSGNVYVVLVPHPSEWDKASSLKVQGYTWEEEAWKFVAK